jgi:NADH:ubiquinone oxidoreductase subunit C
MVLLGNVAVRAGMKYSENGHPVRLDWDATAMRVTNMPEANQYVKSKYRKGWELS